jgi:hypothetical protein
MRATRERKRGEQLDHQRVVLGKFNGAKLGKPLADAPHMADLVEKPPVLKSDARPNVGDFSGMASGPVVDAIA